MNCIIESQFFEIDCDELEYPNLIDEEELPKKAYVPTVSKDEDKMENYKDENENLEFYETGKKKMTMIDYLRIEKRFDKLRFHFADLDNLERRLEKLTEDFIDEEEFLQYSADMLCEINAYERNFTYEKDTITCIKLRTHKNKSYIRFRCNNTMYNLDIDGVYKNGKATGKLNKDTEFYVSANKSGGQIIFKDKKYDKILSSFQNQLSYFKSVKNITYNKNY
tara:strand:- start:210 stop:875 length:666 start_codon:yes stop_codon:yes gene_type:complete